MEEIIKQLVESAEELIQVAKPRTGQIFVLGCSTSVIVGENIGSMANPILAAESFKSLKKAVEAHGLNLAIQCCEHLNRSLVVEATTCDKYNLTEVTVRPIAHAGGSMATAAYENFSQPVVVEKISAHLGLDIGQTLIGMHLKRVAVPVRLKHKMIGGAILTAARTRPPLVGGERAAYPEKIR